MGGMQVPEEIKGTKKHWFIKPRFLNSQRNDSIYSFFDLLDISNWKNELVINDYLDQFFPFFLFDLIFQIKFALFHNKICNLQFKYLIINHNILIYLR